MAGGLACEPPGTGAHSLVARFIGAGKPHRIRATVGQALLLMGAIYLLRLACIPTLGLGILGVWLALRGRLRYQGKAHMEALNNPLESGQFKLD